MMLVRRSPAFPSPQTFWCFGLMALVCMLGMLLPLDALAQTTTPCASDYTPATPPGTQIVNAIVSAVNAILMRIGALLYQSIIANPHFIAISNALLIIYVGIYGIMIMLNMASYKLSEVATRLVKIAIIYSLFSLSITGTSTAGWNFFVTYIGNFFLGGMNELIAFFTEAAMSTSVTPPAMSPDLATYTVLHAGSLHPVILPMNQILTPRYLIAILGMFFTGYTGWIYSLVLTWALFDFVLMCLGAIVTYVKSLVGLTFLFGISPFFLACLLFEKTRHMTAAWLNQVLSFALTPVLVFAFLSFFCVLLLVVIGHMFHNVDFCWAKFTGIIGQVFDLWWWRPKIISSGNSGTIIAGDFSEAWGSSPSASPLNMINLLFFIFICHLGKNFCHYLEEMSQQLTSGIGPGVTKGSDASAVLKTKFTGGVGRMDALNAVAGAAIGGAYRGGRGMVTKISTMVGKR